MCSKALSALGVVLLTGNILAQPDFDYIHPGDLAPGSGEGRADWTVYREGMRFPLETAPAYANSQVWGTGGLQGPPGSQCDNANYSYPWRDNYCETRRQWEMPLCPVGTGHQGQDIRPATCAGGVHWAVAAEAGTIAHIGVFRVELRGEESGFWYRYLHLDHDQLAVEVGQRVDRGDRIGLVSNNFGDTPTTIHLHFDMHSGGVFYPTYMSLVRGYEALLSGSP